MSIIEKIKSFFDRKNKSKALPECRENIIAPEEALKKNIDLGNQELVKKEEKEKSRKAVEEYFAQTFSVEANDFFCIDQISHLSYIMECYLESQIVANNFDYADVNINPEEIHLLIDYIKQYQKGAIEQNISIKLTSEQQSFYNSLTQKEQCVFNSLIVYSEGALEKSNNIDVNAILKAISIYMQNPPSKEHDVRYDDYKRYLTTQERKQFFKTIFRFYKKRFRLLCNWWKKRSA